MARQKMKLQRLAGKTDALKQRITAAGKLQFTQFYKFMIEYNRIEWKIYRTTGGDIERAQMLSGKNGENGLREPLLQIARAQYQIAQIMISERGYSVFARILKKNSRKWDTLLRIANIAYWPTLLLVAGVPLIDTAWHRITQAANTHLFSSPKFFLIWYGLFAATFLIAGIPTTLATKAKNMLEAAERHANMEKMENPDKEGK